MFVGRVVKAPWRLSVSRPSCGEVSIRSLALATRPPSPARCSTTEHGALLDHRVRRATRPPKTDVRWSSSDGALAAERIETLLRRGLDTPRGARNSTTG